MDNYDKYKKKYLKLAAYWLIFTILGLVIAERLTYVEHRLFVLRRNTKTQDGRSLLESNMETSKRRLTIIQKGRLPTEISMRAAGDEEEEVQE